MGKCIDIVGFDIIYKNGERRKIKFKKPYSVCPGDTFKLDYTLKYEDALVNNL
jgi:hypothetical protein